MFPHTDTHAHRYVGMWAKTCTITLNHSCLWLNHLNTACSACNGLWDHCKFENGTHSTLYAFIKSYKLLLLYMQRRNSLDSLCMLCSGEPMHVVFAQYAEENQCILSLHNMQRRNIICLPLHAINCHI